VIARLKSASGDLSEMTSDLRPEMKPTQPGTIAANVKTLTADFADTARTVKTYTENDMAALLGQLRQVNTEILAAARDFGSLVATGEQIVRLNRANIDEAIDNLMLLSANLKAASLEIRRNPWRLVYRPSKEDLEKENLYDAARAFSNGAEQLDQALTKLQALPEDVRADDPSVQRIRRHLNNSFENFSQAEKALWQELVEQQQ
jgi:ABC-type transporter Mla subunit MlaD